MDDRQLGQGVKQPHLVIFDPNRPKQAGVADHPSFPFTWMKGRLTPAANDLFPESFYPPLNHYGNLPVFFAIIGQGNTTRVLVSSQGQEGRPQVRMLTTQLAAGAIEAYSYKDGVSIASRTENATLNQLVIDLGITI